MENSLKERFEKWLPLSNDGKLDGNYFLSLILKIASYYFYTRIIQENKKYEVLLIQMLVFVTCRACRWMSIALYFNKVGFVMSKPLTLPNTCFTEYILMFKSLLLSLCTLVYVCKCKDKVIVILSYNIDIFWVLSNLGVKYYTK